MREISVKWTTGINAYNVITPLKFEMKISWSAGAYFLIINVNNRDSEWTCYLFPCVYKLFCICKEGHAHTDIKVCSGWGVSDWREKQHRGGPRPLRSGGFLSPLASAVTNVLSKQKQVFPNSRPIYSTAESRRARFICCPSRFRESMWGLRTLAALSLNDVIRCVYPSSYCLFIHTMPKGERGREEVEECRLGALWRNLSLSPSLTASSFITSPVTAQQWPGAPQISKAPPPPPSPRPPPRSSRPLISLNKIEVILFCTFL